MLGWGIVKVKELIGLVYPSNRIISIKSGKFQSDWFELNLLDSFLQNYFIPLIPLINLVGEFGGEPIGLFPWALDIWSILANIVFNCWTISSSNCQWLFWFYCCIYCYCFIHVTVSINCGTLVPPAFFFKEHGSDTTCNDYGLLFFKMRIK
jgi:hypothetical protein